MIFLPNHKRNEKPDKQNSRQQQMAERIVNRCLDVQYKASKFLQTKFEALAIPSKRLFVVAFCIVGFGLSVYLSIESFSKQDDKSLSIKPIRVPKQAVQGERPVGVITEKEFKKIGQFRLYLDSLDNSAEGKRIHDSIIIHRPGLIDSLIMVERIYQLQSPNK